MFSYHAIDTDVLGECLNNAKRAGFYQKDLLPGHSTSKIIGGWRDGSKGREDLIRKFVDTYNNKVKPKTPLNYDVLAPSLKDEHAKVVDALAAAYANEPVRGLPRTLPSVLLRKVYVAPGLRPVHDSPSTMSIDGLVEKVRRPGARSLISGDAGMGKTCLLKALARRLIATEDSLPLLVSVASYDGTELSWFALNALKARPDVAKAIDSDEQFVAWIESRALSTNHRTPVILIDDLDHVPDGFRAKLDAEIERLDRAAIVVVKRRSEPSKRWSPYALEPFRIEQVHALAKKLNEARVSPATTASHVDPSIMDLLGTPLFAINYLTGRPSAPTTRVDLLEQIVRRFIEEVATDDRVEFQTCLEELASKMTHEVTPESLRAMTVGIFRRRVSDGCDITADARAESFRERLVHGRILEEVLDRRGGKSVRWMHEILGEYLHAGQLYRALVQRDGLKSFIRALSEGFAGPLRHVFLLALARNRYDPAVIDAAVAELSKAEHGWAGADFLGAMIRTGIHPTAPGLPRVVEHFWNYASKQPAKVLKGGECGFALSRLPLEPEERGSFGAWLAGRLEGANSNIMEKLLTVFFAYGDRCPDVVCDRAETDEQIWDLLWCLWPQRRFIERVNVFERKWPTDVNLALVALKCVVLMSSDWRDGAARFVLLLLARIQWMGARSLRGLGDGQVDGVQLGNGLRVMLAPSIVSVDEDGEVIVRRLRSKKSVTDWRVFGNLMETLATTMRGACRDEPDAHQAADVFVLSARNHYPNRLVAAGLGAPVNGDAAAQLHAAVAAACEHMGSEEQLHRHYFDALAALADIDVSVANRSDTQLAPAPKTWEDGYLLHALDSLVGGMLQRNKGDDEDLLLPALRAQNRWLHLFLDRLIPSRIGDEPIPDEIEALWLALGLAQHQTTWSWPDGSCWRRLVVRQPQGWLARFVWNLVQAAYEPENPQEHLTAARAALGECGPERRDYAEALRKLIVLPVGQRA